MDSLCYDSLPWQITPKAAQQLVLLLHCCYPSTLAHPTAIEG